MRVYVYSQARYRALLSGLGTLLSYFGMAAADAAVPSYDLMSVNNITVPFFGVPLTVLAMAVAGALIGSGFTEPVEKRKNLYFLTIANAMFAAWSVVLLPEWRGWEVSEVAKPPLAGVLAAVNCVIVPAVFKGLPALTGRFMSAMGDAFARFFNRGPTPNNKGEGE